MGGAVERRMRMSEALENVLEKNVRTKAAVLKAFVLGVFILVSVGVVRLTPVKDWLTAEVLGQFLDSAGMWAPAVFIVLYAVGVSLFVPSILLTGLGAALFGPYQGFVYVWIGAMMGSSLAFYIARTLGRDFAASLVGERLKKYDDAIARNGFATVLYLRLVYFPFTPMNFGMGLTKVRFVEYFFATGLGILVGTFIFTFFIGTFAEIWGTGDWKQLKSFKLFLGLGLFVLSFFIPKALKKMKGED